MTEKEILFSKMESLTATFTKSETYIYNYLIENKEQKLQADDIIKQTFTSKATLSRFAKKLGYSGFKELLFILCNNNIIIENEESIFSSYYDLIFAFSKVINLNYLIKCSKLLIDSKDIRIIGVGTSGIIAREFSMRLNRLGFTSSPYYDIHFIEMNKYTINKDTLVIALSASGQTEVINKYLKQCKTCKANSILLSASSQSICAKNAKYKLIYPKYIDNKVQSNMFSLLPQTLMLDLLYKQLVDLNKEYYTSKFQETLINEK